jgi:hypothetical protein
LAEVVAGLSNGIISSVSTILLLPNIFILFWILSILKGSGYLASGLPKKPKLRRKTGKNIMIKIS